MRIQVIHSYDYRPEAIFYGDGPRYFGVELEIDKGGEIGSNVEQILAVENQKHDFYYCNKSFCSPLGIRMLRVLFLHATEISPARTASTVKYCSSDTRIPVAQSVCSSSHRRPFRLAAFRSLWYSARLSSRFAARYVFFCTRYSRTLQSLRPQKVRKLLSEASMELTDKIV